MSEKTALVHRDLHRQVVNDLEAENAKLRARLRRARQDYNDLTEAQAELIACAAEEAAEVIQECGKVLRFGLDRESPIAAGSTPRKRLTEEYGQLVAVMALLIEAGVVYEHAVQAAAATKLEDVRRVLMHAEVPDPVRFTPSLAIDSSAPRGRSMAGSTPVSGGPCPLSEGSCKAADCDRHGWL